MITLVATFVENMYWIDLLAVVLVLCLCLTLVHKNTKKILARNKEHNAELLAMRTEIYTEYEKNFFL